MAGPSTPSGFEPVTYASAPPPPPGFEPIDAVPPPPPGFVAMPPVDISAMDPGKPRPGGQIEAPAEPRYGDALKSVFGGHNPLAETYDLATAALDPRSGRPITERIADTANFAASVPFQMLHLPTPGQMAENVTGYAGSREAEERFIQNNPDLLRGLDAVGTVALQTPLGQGAHMPPPPSKGPAKPLPAAFDAAEDTLRARRMKADMEALGVEPYAPVIAAARSSDNSPGAITQALADKPFVGTPIQRGAQRFVEDLADAQGRIVDDYGQTRTMQGAGATARGGLEQFKEGRSLDNIKALPMEELQPLAASPPRLTSFKDVAAAKYELAERLLPETKAKGQPVAAGEARQMGGMPETIAILRDIKRRYGLTINKSEAAKVKRGAENDLSLENTADFANPRWTGSPNVDQSLNSIISSKGNWRTGLEGMREIRSMIRRTLSAKADTEVNALSNADLTSLYSAVSRDMDGLLGRMAASDKANSSRYLAARDAYKDADSFYARYNQSFDSVRRLLNLPTDEAAAEAIKTALKDGGKGNLEMLMTMRRMLPRQSMDDIAGALLIELGRPTGRAGVAKQEAGLSPARFSSQWNGLSDRAKTIMFGGKPELKRDLDAFARIAQGAADFEALANHSRTGVSNWVAGMVGAGGVGLSHVSPMALIGTATMLVGTRAAAHFLMSPLYVKWLTEAHRIAIEPRPNAVRTHMRKLENMVRYDANLDNPTKKAIISSINASLQPNQPVPAPEPSN